MSSKHKVNKHIQLNVYCYLALKYELWGWNYDTRYVHFFGDMQFHFRKHTVVQLQTYSNHS